MNMFDRYTANFPDGLHTGGLVAPLSVNVQRSCPSALLGSCNCDGSCRKPVSREDRIKALKAELRGLEKGESIE